MCALMVVIDAGTQGFLLRLCVFCCFAPWKLPAVKTQCGFMLPASPPIKFSPRNQIQQFHLICLKIKLKVIIDIPIC